MNANYTLGHWSQRYELSFKTPFLHVEWTRRNFILNGNNNRVEISGDRFVNMLDAIDAGLGLQNSSGCNTHSDMLEAV